MIFKQWMLIFISSFYFVWLNGNDNEWILIEHKSFLSLCVILQKMVFKQKKKINKSSEQSNKLCITSFIKECFVEKNFADSNRTEMINNNKRKKIKLMLIWLCCLLHIIVIIMYFSIYKQHTKHMSKIEF